MESPPDHLEIAEEMLSDAKFNLEYDRSLRTVEDRAFYSMFHATLALLEKIGKTPKTQAGTIILFGEEIVKKRGLMDQKYHSMLTKYQAKRQEADYEKTFLDEKEDVREFVQDAEKFLTKAKEVLNNV